MLFPEGQGRQQNHSIQQQLLTHHDDKDSDKNRNKVSEESEGMLDVVHVPMVCPLDDLLGVKHHVSQENQKAQVELQFAVCMLN